jgi:tellurite resistance protein TerB
MQPGLLAKLETELRRFRDKEFLKATMAACLLIAEADGEVDPVEQATIRAAFDRLPILRELDSVAALRLFEEYRRLLADPVEAPRARRVLYRKVERFQGRYKHSRTLLRAAYLVLGADGVDHPDEIREFKRLCGLLGLDPGQVMGEEQERIARLG